jgi:poly-gamma-glutamate synthesis protein (capsule biosynthesis protein)
MEEFGSFSTAWLFLRASWCPLCLCGYSFSSRIKPLLFLAGLFLGAGLLFLVLRPVFPNSHSPRTPQSEIFLESFFKNPVLYEEAFARAGKVSRQTIQGGIVPHHFLARDLIAAFFAGIDGQAAKRLILVGPDHYRTRYHPGMSHCFTSLLPWRTPFGPVVADDEVIRKLVAARACAVDDAVFMQEHSIYVLVPFIKKTFPLAEIVPLVLRPGPDGDEFQQLGKFLRRNTPPGTVMIVSSDFAHGVTAAQARVLDRKSIQNLKNLHRETIGQITCDCRRGLATLSGFLGAGRKHFSLVGHRTSLDFGSRGGRDLTSYIAAYYRAEAVPGPSLLFVGDLMFDRAIRRAAQWRGNDYVFAGVKELFSQNDLVIANLEGPITDRPSVSLSAGPQKKNHYVFTFDRTLAGTMKKNHITLVNLGNNHVLDQGEAGLKETLHYLNRAGVDHFGAPDGAGSRSLIKELGGVKMGFVNFNQFSPGSVENTLAEIAGLRPLADLVVLYAHWGAEYHRSPGSRIQNLARRFIDQGADLVVGSHPHVVQEKETYRGKMIYYSLGNFVFDQYNDKDACRGLALRVSIDPGPLNMTFQEIPLELTKTGQTRIVENF